MEKTLIIATRNSGKTKEFKKLFADFGYEIKDLTDYPELPEIEETGTTFEENARLKAEQIAEITGQVVIGDDSGLCVDVLGGLPGIWSHRFSAPDPTDEKKYRKTFARTGSNGNYSRTLEAHISYYACGGKTRP